MADFGWGSAIVDRGLSGRATLSLAGSSLSVMCQSVSLVVKSNLTLLFGVVLCQ